MTGYVAVIDYGMGNLHSVASALEHAGAPRVEVSHDPEVIAAADRVVFPGVGAIRDCMAEIRRLGCDRLLQSVLQGPGGAEVRGLVIGRSPPSSKVTRALLAHVVETKPQLRGKPVVYGVDFGHTTPHTTFPLGGTAWVRADADGATIEIRRH